MITRFLFVLMVCLTASNAMAHDARPVVVSLEEVAVATYQLSYKVPANAALSAVPQLQLPTFCEISERVDSTGSGDGRIAFMKVQCQHAINDEELTLKYGASNPGLFTLFRFVDQSGNQVSSLQRPDQLSWRVPSEVTTGAVFQQYTVLGVEHIWMGLDHLLFVVCLLWLVGLHWRALLLTITGFTLAHSVTLILSSLNIVQLPIAAVEASIALSILFLAREIATDKRHSIVWRYPVLVSSSFGLLHGFGFASVLRDIGLPQGEIATALLSFNLGVEVGQVIFIGAMLALYRLVLLPLFNVVEQRHSSGAWWLSHVPVYSIGVLAAYWTIERFELVVGLG